MVRDKSANLVKMDVCITGVGVFLKTNEVLGQRYEA